MRVVGIALVALAAFVARPAFADEPLRLAWRAPAGCPSSETIRAAALRGARGGASVPIEAEATVERRERAGARWVVTLRTQRADARGERVLEADTCAALGDATAVILALALVPPGAADAEPTPAPTATSSPSPTPPATDDAELPMAPARAERGAPPAADRATTPSRARQGPALALGAWGAVDAATLPGPAIGGGGSVAWTPGALRIEGSASTWTAQSSTVHDSTAGARFAMTSVSAGACHDVLRGGVVIAPCAVASMHFVSAQGFGATENYDATARWVSIDGGLLARLPLASWLGLRARADALVPLARPTFAVENEGVVHRPPPVGLRASLGAELTFL